MKHTIVIEEAKITTTDDGHQLLLCECGQAGLFVDGEVSLFVVDDGDEETDPS